MRIPTRVPYPDRLPNHARDRAQTGVAAGPGAGDDGGRADELVGRCLDGKFLLRQRIGEGSCGRVYLADQLALQRSVAVKVIHLAPDADLAIARRFHGEAFAASKLHHPNVISIYDHGQSTDGLLYIAMEYLRGHTLYQIVHDEHPLPPARVAHLLAQVLSGLEEAHAAGVVHADLKSDNIVIHRLRDGGELAKIVDFGIARILHGGTSGRPGRGAGQGQGQAGLAGTAAASPQGNTPPQATVSGTPGYIAPEVIAGAAPTPLADIYAAGVLLYEMLTGAAPFSGNSVDEILARHLEGELVLPSVRCPDRPIPPGLEQVALRALARDPGQRFADAASFREALRAVGVDATEVACPVCTARHGVRSRFCSECGARLDADQPRSRGRARQEITRAHASAEQALARGDATTAVDTVRHAVGKAIRLGDVSLIRDGYRALATMLERTGAIDDAIQELEEGVDMLTAGQSDKGGTGAEGLWALLLKLAELYRQRGHIDRALSTCARALFHVRNDASAEGRAEAQALMRRLYTESRQRGQRRVANPQEADSADGAGVEEIDLSEVPPLG